MEKSLKIASPFLILALAFLLRIYGLNQSLWLDEAISATVVKNHSYSYIWSVFVLSDTHPPLYYILLKFWSGIFGYWEIALRLPSVFFGLATVYFVYRITIEFDKKAAFLAGLLAATSGLLIYYSQEVRAYSLTTFLVALLALLFLKRKWIPFSLTLLILALIDYLPLIIILVFWLCAFIVGQKKLLVKLGASYLPLILFAIWWYPVFWVQKSSTLEYLEKFPAWGSVLGDSSLKNMGLVGAKFILGRISFDDPLIYASVVLFCLATWLFILTRSLKKAYIFLWLWAIVPVTALFVIGFFTPGFSYFRLIFALPPLYVLLAIGVYRFKSTNLRLKAAILLLTINISSSFYYLFNTNFWREDWRQLVFIIEERLKGGEMVMVSYAEPFAPYVWYAKEPRRIVPFSREKAGAVSSLYTLDYLSDLTDLEGKNTAILKNLGFSEENIYNFRGTGQVRYWVRR